MIEIPEGETISSWISKRFLLRRFCPSKVTVQFMNNTRQALKKMTAWLCGLTLAFCPAALADDSSTASSPAQPDSPSVATPSSPTNMQSPSEKSGQAELTTSSTDDHKKSKHKKSSKSHDGKVSKADSDDKSKKNKRKATASVTSMLTWVDPEKEPKAALLCVHGLGLYNNTYEEFGKALSKRGYAVFAMDVPGFGSFQNKETHQEIDFEVCLEDMTRTIKLIRRAYPKLPIFVLGESMGGAIVLRYTSEHPDMVTGMITSVPSGDRFKQGKEKLRVGLKLLTAPNKPFDIGTGVVERATKKEDLKKAWSGDRLNRMFLSPKDLIRFQNFMNENHDWAKQITKTPVLFVQGCEDKLVRPEGTVSLFNRIGCPDKQLELIHDAEHLIFEEGQFDDKVVQIVDTWVSNHITKMSAEQDNQLRVK